MKYIQGMLIGTPESPGKGISLTQIVPIADIPLLIKELEEYYDENGISLFKNGDQVRIQIRDYDLYDPHTLRCNDMIGTVDTYGESYEGRLRISVPGKIIALYDVPYVYILKGDLIKI